MHAVVYDENTLDETALFAIGVSVVGLDVYHRDHHRQLQQRIHIECADPVRRNMWQTDTRATTAAAVH